MIRALEPRDIEELQQIHAKFYSDEFQFPDFFQRFICAFVVKDDDKIVSVGGVQPIAESIIITNKELSVKKRREALLQVLDASRYIANRAGYNQLHALIQDKTWKNHLMKYNFHPCKGEALFLNLE